MCAGLICAQSDISVSTIVLLSSDTVRLLTETTAVQNGVALSYHSVRGLYFLAVVFAATIILSGM